jgi:hypothetical protein
MISSDSGLDGYDVYGKSAGAWERRIFMLKKINQLIVYLGVTLISLSAFAQVEVPLSGRAINKLLPDYGRPKVYALNAGDGSTWGTLLALDPATGAILSEILLNLNPTDMAMTSRGDALYVINAGSRTISKVDLNSFDVVAEKAITTPWSYNPANPLHVVAGKSNQLFFTDGAWGPQIYSFDFVTGDQQLVLYTGGNQNFGAGGLLLNRSGNTLYTWAQYGWSAGNVNSWVARHEVSADGGLTGVDNSFVSWRRDPFDTPLLLDGAERWVFNKQQMFAANDLSVLVNQFADNIYGISFDGSLAFGPSEVFNTANGNMITNLPYSTTVMTLSGDQQKLLRYQADTSSIMIYDMRSIASVNGPAPVPTPADGAVVSLPRTNLCWTVSPLALAYDIYFGTNQSNVAAATSGSTQYLGRTTATSQLLPLPLEPEVTYYWRVDVVGFGTTNSGPVWAFTTSALSVAPDQVNCFAIEGYNPASVSLGLSSASPVPWTAVVAGSDWLSVSPATGTTPGTLTVSFNTAALPAGHYTNNIRIAVGNTTLLIPVSLVVQALNITKMVADPQRPYLYAIQPPELAGQSGLLLFINATNGNIDKTLPIGINPVDLSINRAEDRLYVASWTEMWTYVVDLQAQTLLPSLSLGTDVFKINAGRQGRLVTEGMDQWITGNLIDTTDGASLASVWLREGDGDFDPTGRYYYHVDNNISDAAITKYDTLADTFDGVASSGARGSYYGSRNLVISADGSRLFWTRMVFDADLVSYGMVPGEVYSCSTNGRVAFGDAQAYDGQTCEAIHNLPASTTVSVVDGQNQRFWWFANGVLDSAPMSTIQSPSITMQPDTDIFEREGASVYLTVTAIGMSPLSYQWTFDGNNLSGETNGFLSIPNLQPSQFGTYRVVVTNPFGAITSSVAEVSLQIPPSILNQPVSTNVQAGQSFTLSVTPAGSAPFSYQWFFEDSAIDGATASTLTIDDAQFVNDGSYSVTVHNAFGSVSSTATFVHVQSTVTSEVAAGYQGGSVVVPIDLAARGDEHTVSFSLTYDTAVLSKPQLVLDATTAQATVTTNPNQHGTVGIVLRLNAGQSFAAGTRRILGVAFAIANKASVGTTPIAFGDAPIKRSIADEGGKSLMVKWTDGHEMIRAAPQGPVISGTVTRSDNGAGKPGVTITFSGVPFVAVTDANGRYSMIVSNGWRGTATASYMSGGFATSNRTFGTVTANRTSQNFVWTPSPTISGRVTRSGTTAGLPGVTITFSGDIGATTTDSKGAFSMIVPYKWTGTATASFARGGFATATKSYNALAVNKTAQNFVWTADPVISGTVFNGSTMRGIPNGFVYFSNGGGMAATDVNGKYTQTVPYGWTGSVTLAYPDIGALTPGFRAYDDLKSNMTKQNFIWTASGAKSLPKSASAEGHATTLSSDNNVLCTSGEAFWTGADAMQIQAQPTPLTIRIVDGAAQAELAVPASVTPLIVLDPPDGRTRFVATDRAEILQVQVEQGQAVPFAVQPGSVVEGTVTLQIKYDSVWLTWDLMLRKH